MARCAATHELHFKAQPAADWGIQSFGDCPILAPVEFGRQCPELHCLTGEWHKLKGLESCFASIRALTLDLHKLPKCHSLSLDADSASCRVNSPLGLIRALPTSGKEAAVAPEGQLVWDAQAF